MSLKALRKGFHSRQKQGLCAGRTGCACRTTASLCAYMNPFGHLLRSVASVCQSFRGIGPEANNEPMEIVHVTQKEPEESKENPSLPIYNSLISGTNSYSKLDEGVVCLVLTHGLEFIQLPGRHLSPCDLVC